MAPTENKAGERKGAAVALLFDSQRTAMPTVKGFVRPRRDKNLGDTLRPFCVSGLHVTPSNPHG